MMDDLNEMGGHIVDWKKYDKNTVAEKVQFTLEALSNTCKERLSMQKSIQRQNELVEQLIRHSSRSKNNNVNTAAISTRSTQIDETDLPADYENSTAEVQLAYYFLKKGAPAVNSTDADEFHHSLQDHTLNIELSSSCLDLMMDELSGMEGYIVNWKKYDTKTFAAKAQFTLEALSNTCNERLSMQKRIQLLAEALIV
jgi:ribosomal protein S8